jgi:Cu/Zn superoxide dismutase
MRISTISMMIPLALLACRCGGEDAATGVLSSSVGAWTVFADPFANGMPNPAAMIQGTARAVSKEGGGMRLELDVSGLPAGRTFGAHLHQLTCQDAMKAGPHYQHTPSPGAANDPAFANAMNEAWLDFTTDAAGAGVGKTDLAWVPRPGEAKAIIVHANPTAVGGAAGARLACLSLPF